MRVLVLGANGFIGGHIVADLLAKGHRVVGAVRDPETFRARFRGAEAVSCDLNRDTHPEDWIARLAGIDAVVNCAGVMQGTRRQDIHAIHTKAPIALFEACVRAGVRRVVQISAISVDASTDYAFSKRRADEHLRRLDLEWTVLRPSLVYAYGSYGGTSMLRGLAAAPFAIPVVGSGAQRFTPISIDDLARTVLLALETPRLVRQVVVPVGPEHLTQAEILRRLRQWLGLADAPLLPIPLAISRVLGWIGDRTGAVSMNSNALDQLEHGNAGDPAAFQAAVGFAPTSFDAWHERHPAEVQDRWHAQLTALRPLVTLTLGALWIGSGLLGIVATPAEFGVITERLGLSLYAGGWLGLGFGAFNLALGAAVLARWRPAFIGTIQSLAVLGYTLGLSWLVPELWIDPYGALLKNLPILALIAVWTALERER